MGIPYLNSDESIILSTHNVLVDAAVSEMILTNGRLLIVDSDSTVSQHKEIPFAAIETVTTMESGSADPAISLAIFTHDLGTRPMQLVFSQQPRSDRTSERDEWAQKIKEQMGLLPAGTAPAYVDFAEDEGEDLKKLIGYKSEGAPAVTEDRNVPVGSGPKRKTSPRSSAPASAALNKNMVIAAGAIIVIILLVAGAAFIYPGFLSAKSSEPQLPVTLVPTPGGPHPTVPTPVLTAEPTPVATAAPEQTPASQPTAITTPQLQTAIPASGVWVQITYDGDYTGSIGSGGRMREVSGTGGRFYQISAASTDIIEVSIQKLDTTGLPMTVEVFNNGVKVSDKTIITPKGTLSMTVDLKTTPVLIATPAVTQ
ncbi:MAG: hypothetical protein CVV30_06300 [Methanomicrobiales archaeon HGW-Methanomicrobiales-1]|jgi:hypothetical protein|nr:MAG: hypothetical protein CVV30_06300 [Methanomicrobiales archaeon HGW-Methanomicrobiales-1]